MLKIANPIRIPVDVAARDRCRSVGRTVVDQQKFEIVIVLSENAFDGFRELALGIVEDRNDRDTRR